MRGRVGGCGHSRWCSAQFRTCGLGFGACGLELGASGCKLLRERPLPSRAFVHLALETLDASLRLQELHLKLRGPCRLRAQGRRLVRERLDLTACGCQLFLESRDLHTSRHAILFRNS